MFKSSTAALVLTALLVPTFCTTACFDSVSLTVYRHYKKIVLQRADTVNDELDATEIIAEDQKIPTLQTACFKNLPKLQYIKVTQCGLKTIEPSAFYNLPQLKSISITFNDLPVISNRVFHSLDIVKLSLIANGIVDIQEHAFYNLTSLEILDLSRNSLYTLKPDIFYKTNNLRQINFSNNKLLHIEDYFFWDIFGSNQDTTTSLIDLSSNNLSTIGRNSFKGLYYIHTLLLNENNINEISPEAFSNLRYGETLDLRDNNLEKLPFKIRRETFKEVLYEEDLTDEDIRFLVTDSDVQENVTETVNNPEMTIVPTQKSV